MLRCNALAQSLHEQEARRRVAQAKGSRCDGCLCDGARAMFAAGRMFALVRPCAPHNLPFLHVRSCVSCDK